MSLALDDPRLAQLLTELVDRRVRAAIDGMARIRYGTVAAVDTTAKTASLLLGGSAVPSPGFVYAANAVPAVGDTVRAVNRGADRYIEAVLTADEVSQARLRLIANNDASLVSTLHALQIGPTDGVNLIADGNEIMARNNGAASTLYLNNEGGDTIVGGPLSQARIGRSMVNTAAHVLTSAATTRLTFNTAMWTDAYTTYSSGSYIIGVAGMYLCTVHGEFASNATGSFRIVGLGRAGGGHPTTWGGFGTYSSNTYAVSYGTPNIGSIRARAAFLVPLAAGDYVGMMAYQNSGGNLDLINQEFTIMRVGGL